MTPLLARSLCECNGVERDAFRQHRGTSVVPATGWWTAARRRSGGAAQIGFVDKRVPAHPI